MKINSIKNKRFFQRLDGKLNLKYKIIKSSHNISGKENFLEQFSVLKNISAGGILFLASNHFPMGTILDINLELLDIEEPINCLTKVLRIEEIEENKTYEIAACFWDLSNADRTRLLKYVEGEW